MSQVSHKNESHTYHKLICDGMGEKIRVCLRAEHMRKCCAPAITELWEKMKRRKKREKTFQLILVRSTVKKPNRASYQVFSRSKRY